MSVRSQKEKNSDLTISVVMATCNGAQYISVQLDSILAQTYPATEIIVQDDQSTDSTWDILSSYAEKYPSILIYRNQERLGLNQNFLSAFGKCKGNYIAVSDQDDYWPPEKLELYSQEVQKGTNVSLVYASSWICDQYLTKRYVMEFSDFGLEELLWKGIAPGHSLMFRRNILEGLRNRDEIDFIYDWLLNIAAYVQGEVIKIKHPLTCWRRHDLTVTNLAFVPPEVPYLRPVPLTLHVFASLFRKEPLPNFSWHFHNLSLILENFRTIPEHKPLIRFLRYYKKERPGSLLVASLYYFLLKKGVPFPGRLRYFYLPIYKYYIYRREGAGLRGV